MRHLDLAGMVLTIIGANIIITAGSIFLTVPRPSYPPSFKFFRVAMIAALIIGVVICVIGIILRIIDSNLKAKGITPFSAQKKKTEIGIVNEIIVFLKNNKGNAFTLNTLINRIYGGNLTGINYDTIEQLLQKKVIENIISSQLKDAEIFFFY
jgi:hypothetical protein